MSSGARLDLDEVSVTMPSGAVSLGPIRLAVAAGELVVITGRNGSGRTTLLRTIVGLRTPGSPAGTIALDGRPLGRISTERRARCGLVLVADDAGLFPGLTVGESLGLASRNGMGEAYAFALFPPLAERRSQRVETLSGGERRLLGLAQAMATAPKVLLVDEPTTGLGPGGLEAMKQALSDERSRGTSILVAESTPPPQIGESPRVFLLEGGRLR